jgi:ABC-type spermidine/putrescine transport system permease subunit I
VVGLLPFSFLLIDGLRVLVTQPYIVTGTAITAGARVGWNTIQIAVWTSVVSLILGFCLAKACSRFNKRALLTMVLLVIMPLFVNQIARNAAWMWLLDASGLLNKVFAVLLHRDAPLEILYRRLGVIVVLAHGMVPIAFLLCLASMQVLDEDSLSAARTCGAGPCRVFISIYLPQIAPGLAASFALVGILTLGYYITPAMLGGRDGIMIAKYIEQLLNRIGDPVAASILALALGLVCIPLAAGLARLLNSFYASQPPN